GSIVEFIDRQKIMCAVVLEVKQQRLRLLTENNREVNLAANRLSHRCDMRLDVAMGRDKMVDVLKEVANKRKALISQIDVKDLWEVLNTEQEWIDLGTMTEFCFPDKPSGDHESAVIRAFFNDRFYFKFNPDRFFPNSIEQVERLLTQQKEAARKERLTELGGDWLKKVSQNSGAPPPELTPAEKSDIVQILKACYLFEKNSSDYALAKGILARAGIDAEDGLWQLLVKLGVFDPDENIDLHRLEIAVDFSDKALQGAAELVNSCDAARVAGGRRDLTALPLMTIDGQATLDYDDALSIELGDGYYRLGIHIVDVGHFVRKGDPIDQEALVRGSSIYMPDQKIPMLPASLAEGLCSLKAGVLRPAISTMVKLSPAFEVIDYEIVPSLVKVKHQLTYYDVNLVAGEHRDVVLLQDIAKKFRQKRLDAGAVQISVPEINVWVNEAREATVTKINRESPGRMLVSEIMIMANWLMAKFLSAHGMPAIFRSQTDPRERLYKGDEGTLFQNWMQRRLLSRFVLNNKAERHAGLGLDCYVTATSPIRKYFDLVTQRQLRAVFGLDAPYKPEEVDRTIQLLELPMSHVFKIQYGRHRYWLLKYLEKRIGQKEEAIVLNKKRNGYQILLTEYMIECDLPLSSGVVLKAEDLIQITIQRVNARKDALSVYIG
ncbi:MAG: RNB domain-containing ribonuclease, partial [Desulfobacterales bacterium]